MIAKQKTRSLFRSMVWTAKPLQRKRKQVELLVSVAVQKGWNGKSRHELL